MRVAVDAGASPRVVVARASGTHRRRDALVASLALVATAPRRARAESDVVEYCDFSQTLPCIEDGSYARAGGRGGALYKEIRLGQGAEVREGDVVIADWDAYTFYLQHVVQARGLAKGGDFQADNDESFLRFKVGDGSVIAGLERAAIGMRVGGIRRIIIRPGEASYPGVLDKRGGRYDVVGPSPSTLSGKRALEFVLRNTANVDKTLLFDLEILKVNDDGGYKRGPGEWVVDAAKKS